MIASSVLLIFLGCFALYNTSKKALLTSNSSIEKWMQGNQKLSKIIGLAFLVVGLVVATFNFGNTSGIFFWMFIITAILSLLIVIYPLKKINYKHLIALFLVLFIIELIIKL